MCGSKSFAACCRYKPPPLFDTMLCQPLIRVQEDSADALHIIIAFLLFDGRQNEATYEMMNEEGVFPRLLELIQGRVDDDSGLHRMLLEMLYEMSRIQRIRMQDLGISSTIEVLDGKVLTEWQY